MISNSTLTSNGEDESELFHGSVGTNDDRAIEMRISSSLSPVARCIELTSLV